MAYAPLEKATEYQIQVSIVDYLRLMLNQHGGVYFHPANGEFRNKATGARLKRMGLVAGVADLFCYRNKKLALIEVKSASGTLSQTQKFMRDLFIKNGAYFAVCRSAQEAVTFLDEIGFWKDRP